VGNTTKANKYNLVKQLLYVRVSIFMLVTTMHCNIGVGVGTSYSLDGVKF